MALAKVPSANSRVYDGSRRIPYSGPDARYRGTEVTVDYAFHDKYPRLTKPHSGLLISPQKAFWRAHATVQKLGWAIVDTSEKDLRIEATDRSLWFGRTSDIVIRVRRAGTIGVRVDVRSMSREAGNDHGRNVERLKAFFNAIPLLDAQRRHSAPSRATAPFSARCSRCAITCCAAAARKAGAISG